MDFNDTFLDFEHLRASFPEDTKIHCNEESPVPPFRLTFNQLVPQHGSDTIDTSIKVEAAEGNRVQRLLGIVPRKNTIRFTPAQIEAIKSGMVWFCKSRIEPVVRCLKVPCHIRNALVFPLACKPP